QAAAVQYEVARSGARAADRAHRAAVAEARDVQRAAVDRRRARIARLAAAEGLRAVAVLDEVARARDRTRERPVAPGADRQRSTAELDIAIWRVRRTARLVEIGHRVVETGEIDGRPGDIHTDAASAEGLLGARAQSTAPRIRIAGVRIDSG